MAVSSTLRVMISSKCLDFFPKNQSEVQLSDIRRSLKTEIEAEQLFGRPSFEVWINEEAPPQGGTWDSWDFCMQMVGDCDILIVISSGDAGWADEGGAIGICHAELMTGLSVAPAKVRVIKLDEDFVNVPTKDRDLRFQSYVSTQSLFHGGTVKTVEVLKKRVKDALRDAVIRLAQSGVREASRGKAYSGAALDWSRLDFAARQTEMVSVLRKAMLARKGAIEDKGSVIVLIGGHPVLCTPRAIPASLGVSAAREMVGQPFLHDHLLASGLKGSRGGPLHIIACNKSATESQALKLLGFPDATLVAAPFGIFVADPIQKVQFAFLTSCRDDASTRFGLQRFFEWLNQTGEDVLLAARAKARARIVHAIAKEANS